MRTWVAAGTVTTIAAVAVSAMTLGARSDAQGTAAPKARYWMSAETTSGFGAGMNPMAMLRGGGGGAQHSLLLRLGTSLSPTGGTAKADHFMPPAAKLGKSVPLAYSVGKSGEGSTEFKRPKARLRIYWGCGAKAGPGQPVVFDFDKIAAGQFPPGLFTATVPVERGPQPSNSRTYGEWPNTLDNKRQFLTSGSSLLGAHRVAGNYSPEINFTLAQDFMPAIQARSTANADGSITASWQPVGGATGYYLNAIGGKGGENSADVVWWTSASSKQFGGGLMEWLSPATVQRLIGQKTVLPPTQTSCMIPAEVKAAAGEALPTFMIAYGPEADFAYPPRPANPRTPWNPEWTAKARFRSTTMMLAGFDMGAAMGGAEQEGQPGTPPKKCKPKRGLGGMLSGALSGALGAPQC